MLGASIYAENEELVEGGIVRYDRHMHIVGIYHNNEEAGQIYRDRSDHFLLNYDRMETIEFYTEGVKGEISIFRKKKRKDIYCFVMIEGTKVIYASEIPQGDCAIIKKFLNEVSKK